MPESEITAPVTGTPAAPGAAPDQAQSVMVVPMSKSASLSADQVEKGFAMWQRLGLPSDDFIKAAAADGQKVVPYVDPRSADEREYDQVFAGAEPDAYRLNWQGRMPEGLSQGDLVKLDGEIRGALSAMNFAPNIGPAVMEQAFDDSRTWARLDATGQALYERQTRADLGRLIGLDKVDAAISNARVVLSLIDTDLREKLLARGLFRSTRTILQLHMQAERSLARADMAQGRSTQKSDNS